MNFLKYASNWKTIMTALLVTIPALVWMVDTRYQTHEQARILLKIHSIDKLYDEIAVLEIDKGTASKRKLQMLDMAIALKLNRIDKLRSK